MRSLEHSWAIMPPDCRALHAVRGADLQSVSTPGLYPAGEGAGYAGGIVSAAVDGLKVGQAVAAELLGRSVAGGDGVSAGV